VGGSADLAKSNKKHLTFRRRGRLLSRISIAGATLHFGVREHAMGANRHGMTLSKLARSAPHSSISAITLRASMRLGALMEIPSLYIFTHRLHRRRRRWSDAPTHRTTGILRAMTEHAGSNGRPMPNEVVEAYKVALQHTHGPSTLVFTRQAMPTFDRTNMLRPRSRQGRLHSR